MSSDRVLTPLRAPAHPTTVTGALRRPAVRLAALSATGVLVLAGCSAGEDDAPQAGENNPALDPVTVEGAFGEEPTVEFDTPFELEESASETLSIGEGEEIEAGDTVTIDYAIASGTDGTELETSFGNTTLSLPLVEGQTTPALVDAIVGETVGSRVLVAVAPEPGAEENPQNPAAAQTIVFVIDVVDVVPERADGEPVEVPEGTPVVETDDEGDVTGVDVTGVTPPEELVVTPVLQGDGPEVQPGDTVTIHYTGVLASDGTQFDSSWERDAPTTFPLGSLIEGWQEGLAGVPVGSRVVLQVPADLAYGDQDREGIPAGSDLVFVIDVLGTEAGAEAPSGEPSPAASE